MAGAINAAGDTLTGGSIVGSDAAAPVAVSKVQDDKERLLSVVAADTSATEESDILERRKTRFESLTDREGHVPDLDHFNNDFKGLLAKDNHNASFLKPGDVKVIFGVITMVPEKKYRDIHRKTWMAQPGACRIGDQADESVADSDNCKFWATFVLGVNNATMKEMKDESQNKRDISVLALDAHKYRIGEESKHNLQRTNGLLQVLDPPSAHDKNFNFLIGAKIKTIGWLRFAIAKYSWATHVVCQDLDTYPHVAPILRDISDPTKSQWASPHTKPSHWSEKQNGMYYGASCGGMTGFKQGALFALSKSFLTCMFENPKLKTEWDVMLGVPGGDALVQQWIKLAMKSKTKTGTCADPWWVGPSSCSWGTHWAHPV